MEINKLKIKPWILVFTLVIKGLSLQGQVSDLQAETVVEVLELELSQEIGDEDLTVLAEELQQLLVAPVYINSEEVTLLAGYGLITERQFFKLREYRYKYGDLLSLNELQTIEGWNSETMQRVMPFVTINKAASHVAIPSRPKPEYHQELLFNTGRVLEKASGYIPKDSLPAAYAGAPWRFGLRYDAQLGNHFAAGFRMEKDPGEEILPYHPEYTIKMNFTDFYSGYFLVKDLKFIRHICIGDYRLRFGRGITLSTGGGFSSWKDPFGISASSRRFRQNTSMAESGYFRGAAMSMGISRFSLDLFYSRRQLDPSGLEADSSGNRWFSSMNITGYHRTAQENASRGLLSETSYGGMADFRNSWLIAGAMAIHSQFSMAKELPGRTYSSLDFSGKENSLVGAFVSACAGKSLAYAEISCNPGHKIAVIAGWQSVLSPDVRISADFRHFPVGFQPGFHASGVGPYGSLSCETGFSLGLDMGLPGRWRTSFVVDAAKNPWFRYQVDGIGRKYAAHVKITRRTDQMDLYLGYTYRQGTENRDGDFHYLEPPVPIPRNQADMQLLLFQDSRFRLKSKITWLAVRNTVGAISTGAAIQEEIQCGFLKPQLRFTLGAILFNTDDYSSGVYLYEPDLLYSSGSQTLYEEGIRSYLLLKWKFTARCEFSIKLARTWYSNKNVIGSGLDQVAGNEKSEIKLQFYFRK